MKRYDPAIETEPYTLQESATMEEDPCGEYFKISEVKELLNWTELNRGDVPEGFVACIDFLRDSLDSNE